MDFNESMKRSRDHYEHHSLKRNKSAPLPHEPVCTNRLNQFVLTCPEEKRVLSELPFEVQQVILNSVHDAARGGNLINPGVLAGYRVYKMMEEAVLNVTHVLTRTKRELARVKEASKLKPTKERGEFGDLQIEHMISEAEKSQPLGQISSPSNIWDETSDALGALSPRMIGGESTSLLDLSNACVFPSPCALEKSNSKKRTPDRSPSVPRYRSPDNIELTTASTPPQVIPSSPPLVVTSPTIEQRVQEKSSTNQKFVRRWTKEQDEQLLCAVKKHQHRNWKAVAEEVESKNHIQCLQRWKKVLQPGLVKGPWTKEEDKILFGMVDGQRIDNWAYIASKISGRTAKQCRERWCLNLDPSINRAPWTPEEDTLLLSLQNKMGSKWAEIKLQFFGRTENSVKTRFKSLMRAKAKQWTPQEDSHLVLLAAQHGKDLVSISNELPGRSKKRHSASN
mmetsp:Transcript_21700/g.47273  ORF Transcript_21700/g.47273 Transcript_21700/m.47273 type:complete len:451 (-) Transcript_21700:3390-4742(-)